MGHMLKLKLAKIFCYDNGIREKKAVFSTAFLFRLSNDDPVTDKIVKCLCEVLIDLGLKLNPNKTTSSKNVIRLAIKEDKQFWVRQKRYDEDLQKHLLLIHDLADKYPNSGSLCRALKDCNKKISKWSSVGHDVIVLISIIVDIAHNNPRVYPQSVAVLSKLIRFIDENDKKLEVFNKIKRRFDKIPNTEHLQLWLQRITIKINKNYEYHADLCKLVAGDDIKIWNFEWLNNSFRNMINAEKIIDYKLIESLPAIIQQDEVDLFKSSMDFY